MTKKNRVGRCYELNFLYVKKHQDFKLVHGYITNKFSNSGQTIDHAWCIKPSLNGNIYEDIVYDAVMEKEFLAIVYHGIFKNEAEHEYSWDEARTQAFDSGTFGPWDKMKELDLTMYDENGNWIKK